MIAGEPECKRIGRSVLPAVRASVAELMHNRYKWRQERIAEGLGVVQVAVSKYLNGRYSKEVLKVRNYIRKMKLGDKIAAELADGKRSSVVHGEMDRLCTELVKAGVA